MHRTGAIASCDVYTDQWTVGTSKYGRKELSKIRALVYSFSNVDNMHFACFALALRLPHSVAHCLT